VAPGNSIQLTIHDFDVEYHASCKYDTLEVGSLIVLQCITKSWVELERSPSSFLWLVLFYA
jgi:hypothetical protein